MCYDSCMAWEIEYTDQFGAWFEDLGEEAQDAIIAAVDVLSERGPDLKRPLVDIVKISRYPNMKELRPPGGNLRILFAFDPRRMAILLIGGDKTNLWDEWYREYVPIADALYADHLEELKEEGLRS